MDDKKFAILLNLMKQMENGPLAADESRERLQKIMSEMSDEQIAALNAFSAQTPMEQEKYVAKLKRHLHQAETDLKNHDTNKP